MPKKINQKTETIFWYKKRFANKDNVAIIDVYLHTK